MSNTDPPRYDPAMMDLIRKVMPSQIAYDILGVQTLGPPTGAIFQSSKAIYKARLVELQLKEWIDLDKVDKP